MTFVKYCRKNGVEVFFSWPSTIKPGDLDLHDPILQTPLAKFLTNWFGPLPPIGLYLNDKLVAENLVRLKEFLREDLKVRILGEPEDFQFLRQYFFDTYYHLNCQGRTLRTRKLIDCLKKFL